MPELPLEKSGFCSHPPGPDNTGLLQADLAPQPCQDLQNKHCPVSFYKLKGCLQVFSELYLFFLHFLSIFLLFLSPFIVKTQEHRAIPLSKMYPLDKKGHSSVKCTLKCVDPDTGLSSVSTRCWFPHVPSNFQSSHARIGFPMNVLES